MQRRLHSFIEACLNTATGFGISVLAGVFVYPLYGVTFTVVQLTGITAIFTIISILRGYMVRRVFNWMHVKGWR